MALPTPSRDFNQPIPNTPFQVTEEYYVKTPQGQVPIGGSLEINAEDGSISLTP